MIKEYDYFKLVHFSKKSGRLSSADLEISAFDSYCSAKSHPIFDRFIPSFKLRYEDSETTKHIV